MAHGTPDWWGVSPKGQTYVLQDDAELAARLDAPNKWERRGDVVWMNTFERGAKALYATTIGVNSEWYLSSVDSWAGNSHLCLVSGNVLGDQCTAHYQFPVPMLGYWGFQYWVSLHDDLRFLNTIMLHSDGTNYYEAMVRYEPGTDELAIQDDDLGWVIIDDSLDLIVHDQTYHIFKVVADFKEHAYHRLLVNDHVYDISDYDMAITAIPTSHRVDIRIETWNLGGVTSSVKVDSLIFTINEPS